ncbi:WXG100 family type VII secretion target [Actinoplanes sp. GCM10030250]|uniref:WXG100 family type VII secretion target n=1 Tax=Actinoplanes sp. GCM10030250 TaxID=3273376 RepID=UPI0036176A1A
MANEVNAVTDQLLAGAKDADQTAENITASLARLMGQLDDLPGGFKGAAATTFEQTKISIQGKLTNITDALHSVSNGITSSSHQFEAADVEAEREVSSILSALGGS